MCCVELLLCTHDELSSLPLSFSLSSHFLLLPFFYSTAANFSDRVHCQCCHCCCCRCIHKSYSSYSYEHFSQRFFFVSIFGFSSSCLLFFFFVLFRFVRTFHLMIIIRSLVFGWFKWHWAILCWHEYKFSPITFVPTILSMSSQANCFFCYSINWLAELFLFTLNAHTRTHLLTHTCIWKSIWLRIWAPFLYTIEILLGGNFSIAHTQYINYFLMTYY